MRKSKLKNNNILHNINTFLLSTYLVIEGRTPRKENLL